MTQRHKLFWTSVAWEANYGGAEISHMEAFTPERSTSCVDILACDLKKSSMVQNGATSLMISGEMEAAWEDSAAVDGSGGISDLIWMNAF